MYIVILIFNTHYAGSTYPFPKLKYWILYMWVSIGNSSPMCVLTGVKTDKNAENLETLF